MLVSVWLMGRIRLLLGTVRVLLYEEQILHGFPFNQL